MHPNHSCQITSHRKVYIYIYIITYIYLYVYVYTQISVYIFSYTKIPHWSSTKQVQELSSVSHFERVQAELQGQIPQKHQVPGTY